MPKEEVGCPGKVGVLLFTFHFPQGSFPECFTEVQMLSQVQPDLLSSFSGSRFKVVYFNPQIPREKTIFQSHRCS